MTLRCLHIAEPRPLRWGLGFVLLVMLGLVGCSRRGVSYGQLIRLVAANECPRAGIDQTSLLVAFVTPHATRYVSYPTGRRTGLDSATLFQLGSLTTAFLVPKLVADLRGEGLTLDSVAMRAGTLVGEPWDLTYGDLLLHHTGLATFEAPTGVPARTQLEEKLTRIGRTPRPQTRKFRFDHWNYTLARMALARRLPSAAGDLRSDGLAYVDRADTAVRRRLAPSEAVRPSTSDPKQATELFVASTGAMASAEQLVELITGLCEIQLDSLPAKPTTRVATDVTLGWYRSALRNGRFVYTNAGRTRRHGAAVAFYPATQTAVVVLSTDSKPVDCVALDLLRNLNDNWKRQPTPIRDPGSTTQ